MSEPSRQATALALVATVWVFACENPQPPEPCGSVPEQTITVGESATVQVCFDDPNGEVLEHRVVSSDPAVATAAATGSTVTVTAVSPGVAHVTMTATDPTGLKAQQGFQVVVPNRPPTTSGTIPDRELMVGDSASLDASGYFSEPDGQELVYAVTVSDSSRLSAAVEAAVLTIVAVAKGNLVVTVTATDPGGLSATQSFLVTVPNRPPVAVDSIAARIIEVDRADTVEVSPFFADPDGDALSYVATVSDRAVIAASASGSTVVVTGVAKGEAFVEVVATDAEGLGAVQGFHVTVPNRPPAVDHEIPAQTLHKRETATLDLSSYFRDPDGDALTYVAETTAGDVVTARVTGAMLVMNAGIKGAASLTVTATDPGGLSTRNSFAVTVLNRAPTVTTPIPARTLKPGAPVTVELSPHFADPDGDTLVYAAESSAHQVVTVSVRGSILTLRARAKGAADVTVTATDPDGLMAEQVLTVAVANQAPIAVGRFPDLSIARDERLTRSISGYFSDPDNDPLEYSGRTADSRIVLASVSGSAVTVTGVSAGQTTLTLTAADPEGLTATQRFAVTVKDDGGGGGGGGGSGFSLSIQYHSSATAAVKTAVGDAASSWESILAATEFEDVTLSRAFTCTIRGVGFTVPAGTLADDIVIAVGAGTIDGSGSPSIVASAGICAARTGSNTPAIGVILFDSADLDKLESLGLLTSVAIHEIGHVVGVGTGPNWSGSIQGTSGSDPDPHFAGTLATAAFNAAGGTSYRGAKVPVQSTSDTSHWRESVLGREIMTPTLHGGVTNPLSAITIQALADMGYSVDASLADGFTLASGDAGDLAGPVSTVDLHGDFEQGPIMVIDANGNVVRVIPGRGTR